MRQEKKREIVLREYKKLEEAGIKRGKRTLSQITGLGETTCGGILRQLRAMGEIEDEYSQSNISDDPILEEILDLFGAENAKEMSLVEVLGELNITPIEFESIVKKAEDVGWDLIVDDKKNVTLKQQGQAEQAVFPDVIGLDDVGFPKEDKDDIIEKLLKENEDLKRNMEWITHSKSNDLTGGVLTLATSDYHFHDKGHLIKSMCNLQEKVVDLIGQFKPDSFRGIVNGDIIPGRGIYRNQQLENVLPRGDQQVAAGIYKFWEFDQLIKKAYPDLPIEWIVLQGNHDYSMGDTTTKPFVWGVRMLGVNAKFVGTEWVQDVSDVGTYNILFEHGYGASDTTPTPPKMIKETIKKIMGYQQDRYIGQDRIHRFCHGHVHWLYVGIERVDGLFFDVTGGLHRNDRVNLGANNRPSGWIAYISPPGSSTILNPIEITPDRDIYRKEILDPELEEKNRQDASRCLEGFTEIGESLGISDDIRRRRAKEEEAT